jgi:hypothetical protein
MHGDNGTKCRDYIILYIYIYNIYNHDRWAGYTKKRRNKRKFHCLNKLTFY